MSTRSPGEPPPVLDDASEYASLRLGSAWGVTSLLFFACSIGARQLVRLLPPHLQGWNIMPPMAVLVVPPLALAGLLAGLVGMRSKERRTLAQIGAALNGIVFLLSLALLLGFWWVRLR